MVIQNWTKKVIKNINDEMEEAKNEFSKMFQNESENDYSKQL